MNHATHTHSATTTTIRGGENMYPFLTFLSGAAALVYESLWMRSFGLIFGNTTHAITVILATYMGGMALGSVLVGRLKIRNPLRTYMLVETGIAIAAALAFYLLRMLPSAWGGFLHSTSLPPLAEVPLRILLSGSVILLPTLLMGATVPLLVEVLSTHNSSHASLSKLYRMNTLGGVVGVISTTYVLFPMLGLSKTYSLAVALNILVAGLCVWQIRPKDDGDKSTGMHASTATPANSALKIPWTFVWIAGVVGASSFSLEILWSRSFALVIGSSIYSFNLMLFSFLLGLVLGTWIYERTWTRIGNPNRLLITLLFGISGFILVNTIVIGWLPLAYYKLMGMVPVTFVAHQVTGFFLCFLVMVILTTAFGYIFPLLLHLVREEIGMPETARKATAKLYAWNTLGTLLGTLATGFVLIPLLGLQKSYVCAAALPLLLGLILLTRLKAWNYSLTVVIVAITVPGLILLTKFWSPWEPAVMTAGLYKYGIQIEEKKRSTVGDLLKSYKQKRQIMYYKEGLEGVVAVTQLDDDRFLSVNGKTDASTDDMNTQKFLAHAPLMLHPDPKKILVIGWGSGCTAGAASLYPIQTLDVVEIEPAVFGTSSLFADINRKVYDDKRFHMFFKDGRNMLLTTPHLYDVIISEPSNPWITGVSNLFTKEFYEISLSQLERDGIFCQWFHIYDMPRDVMQSQVRTFCSAFPAASLWIVPLSDKQVDNGLISGDVILLGSRSAIPLDMARIKKTYALPGPSQDLISMGMENPLSFASNALLDRDALIRFADNARLNTDDYPYVEFNAPHGLFQTQMSMQDNLMSLYNSLQFADLTNGPPLENESMLESASMEEHAHLYQLLGELSAKKSLMSRAERLLTQSFGMNPKSAACAMSLMELNMRQGKYDNAIHWCKVAIDLDPADINSWDILGTLYYKSGQLEEAKNVYRSVMEQFPKEALGAFSLGMIYYQEGNYQEASKLLEKALQQKPDLDMAQQALQSIHDRQRATN